MFSIIIPTFNNLNYLKLCIKSLKKNSKFRHEIIIHVNEGTDGTLDYVVKNNLRHTHTEKNVGLCTAVNLAAAKASTEFIVFAHDDMYFCPGWDTALDGQINQLNTKAYFLSGTMIEKRTGHIQIDCGNNYKDFDEENFEVVEDLAKAPEKDELLIKVDTLAIDAWIRTTLHEGSYHDSAQEGKVISALGIGEGLISKSEKFQEGDFVSGPLGAQTHTTMHAAAFVKINNPHLDPEVNIGLIGLTSGLTAYFGLIDVGKVKEGETVVVSDRKSVV